MPAQGRIQTWQGRRTRRSARGRLTALLAACALAAAALAALPTVASAVIVHLEGGPTVSYQPLRGSGAPGNFDAFFSNLDYNGGPVMPSNTNYAIYWAPSGSPPYPADYQPGLNQFFEDLAHDSGGHENVDSVSSQYNDASGHFASYQSTFGGALLDTDPYPANGCKHAKICLTDAQLRAELTKFVTVNLLPHNLTHEYFLLTPPGVEDCFQAAGSECSAGSNRPAYCAYHSNIPLAEGEIVYSNDPYVSGNFLCDDGNHPNGKSSDGALEGGLSHEHNESITDPEPNNAWTDIGGSGGENGDKCRTFVESTEFGTPLGTASNGAKYNQVIDGRPYWYQQEWSNQTNQCLQRLTFSGAEPTATFTSHAGGGLEVTFDATGSTAPGGVVRYNWQFNDGPGLSIPTETSTPTVTHVFPVKGAYAVALTVFAKDGTSIGAARVVEVGNTTSAPAAVTGAATGILQGGATLNGTVNPNGVAVTECRFEYGLTTAYGSSVPCASLPGSGGSPVAVSAAVSGLSAYTPYHFRLVATNAGATGTGADGELRTLAGAPAVVTGTASAVSQGGATLNGTVNPEGPAVTECRFEYGTTAAYGSSVPCASLPGAGSSPVAVSAVLSGLSTGSSYHFRLLATTEGGSGAGADASFSTNGAPEFGRCVPEPIGNGAYAGAGCTRLGGGLDHEWIAGTLAPSFQTALAHGSVVLETVTRARITCTGESGIGEYTSAREVGGVALTFTGCQHEGIECANRASAGTVVSEPLRGFLGVSGLAARAVKDKVGLELLAAAKGGPLLEFGCGVTTVSVTGALIAPLKTNTMASATELKFKAAKGRQKPAAFAGGSPVTLEASFDGAPREQAGLTMRVAQTNGEPLEVNSVF